MAITESLGYGGTITEDDLPRWRRSFAGAYGIVGPGDWKVTEKSGTDRTLRVAAGDGYGHLVLDTNDDTATDAEVTLATLASGTRYDLIVARRDWSGTGGTTTFDKVTGTSSSIAAFSTRNQTPGTLDDQPLALVTVQGSGTGGSITSVRDVRVWQDNGGAVASDVLALQYINSIGSEVRIGDTLYTRAPDGLGGATWTSRDVGVVEHGLTWATNWTGSNAAIKVIDGKTAHFEGRIIRSAATAATSTGALTTLPVAARPLSKVVAPVSMSFSTSTSPVGPIGHLVVDTNGQVSVTNPFGGDSLLSESVAVWHVGTICWPVA
jgi:hypothetical protein